MFDNDLCMPSHKISIILYIIYDIKSSDDFVVKMGMITSHILVD